ncbi:DNA replication and repair protein RecF [Candidatus Saccharibacteria bacterium]|nr:DNA replication and repair protein RecF [Candidatus Saccharibacteria bacterium]
MIIKSIDLTNFRSHDHYHLDCEKQTSLILGPNGCGKTSVLEGIYLLTRGKSFRATDPDIIKRGTSFYHSRLEYLNGEEVSASYDGTNKFFHCGEKKSKRLPQKAKYPVVLFVPSDLNLISHAPSRRRDYFDIIFGGLDENYSSALSKYKKALRQRSEILKNETITPDQLFSWNLLLSRYGTFLANSRAKYINEINNLISDTYHSIANNSDLIDITYQSDTDSITEDRYLSTLEKNFTRDHYLGHTTFGVHRDDYVFNFNSRPADGSASRGETRSIILSLKFIEADLFEKYLHRKPLILLDDVFSELDEARRESLVSNFQNHQVIITSVESGII